VVSERHPYAGNPFTDDDASIAAALQDVSVPALMCSMVHLTGDPSWIRGDIRPAGIFLNEYQGFMPDDVRAEARTRAHAAIIAYRDAGCVLPPAPSREILHEMMSYLAVEQVSDEIVPMFLDDLGFEHGDELGTKQPSELGSGDLSVVVIGCGEAGLAAGIRLGAAGIPYTIIEKNSGPGGTWWENRYPGARVDIGSHFYCYSFEPADHWTEYFSQQPELQRYFSDVMKKHGVDRNCHFDTEVVSATWDERHARWDVEVRTADGTTTTLHARVVISAVGALNRPKMPEIDGIDDFAGPSFHSARWDRSVDYRGKRVAQIGAGASGFQLAPALAADVEHLTVFQRTAQWMIPSPNYHRAVPDGDKWAMRHLPFYERWFRFLTAYPGAGLHMDFSRIDPAYDDSDGSAISATNKITGELFLALMAEQIDDDPELLAKVTPDYPATAKRTLQDDGTWLRCLQRDNVDLVRTPIERIVPDGVVTTDGVHHPVDIICYATGFRHNDYLWPMTITGRNGVTLREFWGDEPSAYLGMTVPGFPNFFCLYGPGTSLAHGSNLIFQSECQVHYVLDALRVLSDHAAMEPTEAAYLDYVARYRSEIDKMVWSHWSVKHSHFKNPDGKIHTVSPWPVPTYWNWTRAVDLDAYALTNLPTNLLTSSPEEAPE
jgi:4-hydroxyacetophenone monooxygenase